MDKHHSWYSGSVWHIDWSYQVYVGQWPIFYGPAILLHIVKTIWWRNVLLGIMDRCDSKIDLVKYRKTGNFRVVQFSRNFAICINPRKLKSVKYFPLFEELVAYMVEVCGSYLFACGKTSNMQLSQNNLSLQAIWLEVNWSMTDPIYSVSHWLIFFCCCI